MGLKNLVDDNSKNMSKNNINRQVITISKYEQGKQFKYCRGCSTKPICGVLLDADSKEVRCSHCKTQYNQDTSNKHKKQKQFYSSGEWKELRNKVREENFNICLVCGSLGVIEQCTEVHHMESIYTKSGWNRRLDKTNLICLCEDHHDMCHSKELVFLFGLDGCVDSFRIDEGEEVEMVKTLDELVDKCLGQVR